VFPDFSRFTNSYDPLLPAAFSSYPVLRFRHQDGTKSAQSQSEELRDVTASGYQWKQVFLPEGTVLRASFDRQPYYAVVEGATIKYGQHCLSPSAFANLQGSGNRNAWKAIWLRFPGCPDWVRGDECRAVRQALTARLFAPSQPGEADQPEAKPARRAGCHEQHYSDNRPSKDDAVPFHQLLNDFPEAAKESREAGDTRAVSDVSPPSPSQQSRPAAAAPRSGMKPHKSGNKDRNNRSRKAGKRHQAS